MRTSKYSLLGLIALTGLAACSTKTAGTFKLTAPDSVACGQSVAVTTTSKANFSVNPEAVTIAQVVSFSADGMTASVKGLKNGTFKLSASQVGGTGQDSKQMTVTGDCTTTNPGEVAITITPGDQTMVVNQTVGFTATVTGPAGTNTNVSWVFLPDVATPGDATLSSNNAVSMSLKATAVGTGVLKATSDAYPTKSASVKITIVSNNPNSASITITPDKHTMNVQQTKDFKVSITGLANTAYAVRSSDSTVVAVGQKNGDTFTVTSLKVGQATLTVEADGKDGLTATALVTVNQANGGVVVNPPANYPWGNGKFCSGFDNTRLFPGQQEIDGVFPLEQSRLGNKKVINYIRGDNAPVTVFIPKSPATARVSVYLTNTQANLPVKIAETVDANDLKAGGTWTFNLNTLGLKQGQEMSLEARYYDNGVGPFLTQTFKAYPDNQAPTTAKLRQFGKKLLSSTDRWYANKSVTVGLVNPAQVEEKPDPISDAIDKDPFDGGAGFGGVCVVASNVTNGVPANLDLFNGPLNNKAVSKVIADLRSTPFEQVVDTVKALPDGMWLLKTVTYDVLGNMEESNDFVVVYVDNTGPKANFDMVSRNPLAQDGWLQGNSDVDFSVTDNIAGVKASQLYITIGNQVVWRQVTAPDSCPAKFAYSTVDNKDGTAVRTDNTFEDTTATDVVLHLKDCLDNSSEVVLVKGIDNTAPNVDALSPTNGQQFNGGDRIDYRGMASDDTSGLYVSGIYNGTYMPQDLPAPIHNANGQPVKYNTNFWFQVGNTNRSHYFPSQGPAKPNGPVRGLNSGEWGDTYEAIFNDDGREDSILETCLAKPNPNYCIEALIKNTAYGSINGVRGETAFLFVATDRAGNTANTGTVHRKYGGGGDDGAYVYLVKPKFDDDFLGTPSFIQSRPYIGELTVDSVYKFTGDTYLDFNDPNVGNIPSAPFPDVLAGQALAKLKMQVSDAPLIDQFGLYATTFHYHTMWPSMHNFGAANAYHYVDVHGGSNNGPFVGSDTVKRGTVTYMAGAYDKGGNPSHLITRYVVDTLKGDGNGPW